MSVICTTNCGSINTVPASYGGCRVNQRKFGFTYFILFKCDVTWDDILDTTEWTTKLAANEVNVSPPGIIEFPTPTLNNSVVTGCGLKLPLPTLFQANYSTVDTDDDLADFSYWRNILNNYQDYRLGFLDCEDNFYLDSDWVDEISDGAPATIASESPGLEFSVTQAPHFGDNGDGLFQWNTQFEIEKEGILEAAKLPGVAALLK